jgi:hypothetical protein
MGRKMNDLEDDGRPLTAFVLQLRELREECGSPTLVHLGSKAGYPQPRLEVVSFGESAVANEGAGDGREGQKCSALRS